MAEKIRYSFESFDENRFITTFVVFQSFWTYGLMDGLFFAVFCLCFFLPQKPPASALPLDPSGAHERRVRPGFVFGDGEKVGGWLSTWFC